ncbi:MAG TPA: GGDEF domain-containing protein [Janthinobacterium sp.]|nr:GGDEF domain-containing protein [Janthinobacterium sp.]
MRATGLGERLTEEFLVSYMQRNLPLRPVCMDNQGKAVWAPPAGARSQPVLDRRITLKSASTSQFRHSARAFRGGGLARLIAALVCAWLLTAVALAAPGADAARWRALSDTLFKHHAEPEVAGATCFAQDGSGFLWIGTQAGLLRWDGYRFRRYGADPRTPGALADGFVQTLHVDPRGRLWIGTSAGGLARYDAAHDRFVMYGAGAGGLSDASVSALADAAGGGLWVGTGAGLDQIDAAGVLRRAPAALRFKGGVGALLGGRDGTLWVGTRAGLLRRPPGATAFRAEPLATADGAPSSITRLTEDSAGRIWVGTRLHGVFVIDRAGAGARAPPEDGAAAGLRHERVMSLLEASDGVMWIGTEGGGIVVLDTRDGSSRRIRHHAGVPASLSDNDAVALHRERSGLIWVASTMTISQYDPQQSGITSLFLPAAAGAGLSQVNIPAVLAAADGRIWLAVDGGGIDIIDALAGRTGQLKPDPAAPARALPKGRVLALAAAPDGTVYIGTQRGLYRSDADGRHLLRLQPGRRPIGAPVQALCFHAGVLWLGGDDGLWALAPSRSGRLAALRHDEAALGDSRVTAIAPGRGPALWIGTRAGLARLDTRSGALERVPADVADPSRLPVGFISSLLLDARGRLWVSIFGVGICVQTSPPGESGAHLRWRLLGLRDGLPDSGVDMLLQDAGGAVWASTDNGLARINPNSLKIDTLQQPQGVQTMSYWTGAGAVSAAGELLFGGQGGLTVVRPERVAAWRYRPPVVVTDARLGQMALAPLGLNEPGAALELAPGTRSLWVEFSALDYSAPERNRYAYRLDGFDSDWIAAEPGYRRANYTNLPPGQYTLRLRGSNRDGVWSPELALPLRVLPAWHQSAWFHAAATLATLAVLATLLQARTGYLRRRQRALESMVSERTAALRESQRRLELIAFSDPLTGLPNRRVFNDELLQGCGAARRGGAHFTLLLVDLDHFKDINDALGHDAGDALLVEAAARLTGAVRAIDRVARLGGDEFAVLLTQTADVEAVEQVCRRIVACLAEPVRHGATTMRISASIGAARCPGDGERPDALYKAADIALYQAKRDGRNTWRWHAGARAPTPAP